VDETEGGGGGSRKGVDMGSWLIKTIDRSGYIGIEKREEIQAKYPQVQFIVAAKRGKIKAMKEGPLKEATVQLERAKAQVRALVEHPFHIIKNLFRHRRARYRGLAKNC
jgi:IS5 family transposase